MADDSNFDSWNKNQWKLHDKNGYNLLFARKSGDTQDFESSKINHLLSKIVCNHQSSHNRELGEAQLRRINSAIYAESIKSNYTSTPDLAVALSNISIDDNQAKLFKTYRCESLISSKTSGSRITATTQSKSLTRVEHRCRIDDNLLQHDRLNARPQSEIQRYELNGHKVIHISTSLSSCALSSRYDYNTISIPRNRAHAEWIRKKKLEMSRKRRAAKAFEMKNKISEEKLALEKAECERKERENFLIWIERKKLEDEHKRKILRKERELEKQLMNIEAKEIPFKEFRLRQWYQKKEKMLQIQKQEEELKIKQREEEMKKRQEENAKAFELWCQKTKNRPRPATQGLLPHQQAKPSYVNPIPWTVDNDTLSEMQNNSSQIQMSSTILSRSENIQTIIMQQ